MNEKQKKLVASIDRMEQDLRRAAARVVVELSPEVAEDWRVIVRHALKAGLTLGDIAVLGATSVSSASRWSDGTSTPSVAARRWIHEELHQKFAPILELAAAE